MSNPEPLVLSDGDRSRCFSIEELQQYLNCSPTDDLFVYFDIDNGFEIHCGMTTVCLELGVQKYGT